MGHGIPRRSISDNGPQFVFAIMQQLCYLLDIQQSLIPVYQTQANPVVRKNMDLKPRLAIMVNNRHNPLSEKLSAIRFILNTLKCSQLEKQHLFSILAENCAQLKILGMTFVELTTIITLSLRCFFISRNWNDSLLKPNRSYNYNKTEVNHLLTENGDLLLHLHLDT